MNIMITGAAGFLGSHISKALMEKHNLILLKRSSSDINIEKNTINKVNYYDVDLVSIEKIFEENPIDVIIHSATTYGRNEEEISEVLMTNLLYPIKIIEIANKYGVESFLNCDTSLPRGKNKYSLSKKQFLDWASHINNISQIINMKIEILYGPVDSPKKFVSGLIDKLLKNDPEIDMTKGVHERDFIYITDAVNAFVTVVDSLQIIGSGYHEFGVGSGQSISIKEFAVLVKSLTRSKSNLKFGAIPYENLDDINLKADISEIVKLGWRQEETLNSGLMKTIKYKRAIK